MPELERRIKDGLDRLMERPDPAQIVERVGERKRHLRVLHRVQTVALVVAVLAGVAGGTYGLSRAFGLGSARPGSSSIPPAYSPVPSVTPSPQASPTPSPSAAGIALCSDQSAVVTVVSQTGGAGTISTTWRITNTARTPCRSFGYPGMDFHTSTGWLNVHVIRGQGFANVDYPPTSIVVLPGHSMYFVSDWGDVSGPAGLCLSFDRVKVTLPGNRVPVEVASSGCLDPVRVHVGPVTKTPPP
jgi:hypothetical protein